MGAGPIEADPHKKSEPRRSQAYFADQGNMPMVHSAKTKPKKQIVVSPVKYSESLEEIRAKNPLAFISQAEVQRLVPFSRIELWRRYTAMPPKFPIPFRLGNRNLYWRKGEVFDWLRDQEAARATVKKMSYSVSGGR
jgi:predicted DNA-binding transcriptional regulator AlpA